MASPQHDLPHLSLQNLANNRVGMSTDVAEPGVLEYSWLSGDRVQKLT